MTQMKTNGYHKLKENAYLRKGKGGTGKTGRAPLRILSAGLSLSMLLTGCGSLSVTPLAVPDGVEQLESALQEGHDYDTGTNTVIAGFGSLPEDIREQSVPLGTAIGELTLPDTLEASIVVKNSENEGGG